MPVPSAQPNSLEPSGDQTNQSRRPRSVDDVRGQPPPLVLESSNGFGQRSLVAGEEGGIDSPRRGPGEDRDLKLRGALRDGGQDTHLIGRPCSSPRQHQGSFGTPSLRRLQVDAPVHGPPNGRDPLGSAFAPFLGEEGSMSRSTYHSIQEMSPSLTGDHAPLLGRLLEFFRDCFLSRT
jgi:hypothetical protein